MLSLNIRTLFAPRKPRPAPVQSERIVNVHDFVLTVRGFGEITDIGTPYCDGVKRAYIEGVSWADWLTIEEIL